MLRISIDGACRRNGKPDCVASGGVFMLHDGVYKTISTHEKNSTNQRGELLALIKALEYIVESKVEEDIQIITDSEYLFNAMTKCWYLRWSRTNWLSASGETVKNKDLWQRIYAISELCPDIQYYHIKGHCIPFGKVTACNLLTKDNTGETLLMASLVKFDEVQEAKQKVFEDAQQLSLRNNGFELPDETFKQFVAFNIVADNIATVEVDDADRKI